MFYFVQETEPSKFWTSGNYWLACVIHCMYSCKHRWMIEHLSKLSSNILNCWKLEAWVVLSFLASSACRLFDKLVSLFFLFRSSLRNISTWASSWRSSWSCRWFALFCSSRSNSSRGEVRSVSCVHTHQHSNRSLWRQTSLETSFMTPIWAKCTKRDCTRSA